MKENSLPDEISNSKIFNFHKVDPEMIYGSTGDENISDHEIVLLNYKQAKDINIK